MLKFILIAVVAYVVGVIGWAQFVGSLQNIRKAKKFAVPLVLWAIILTVGAYVAIYVFDDAWALAVGYGISLFQILISGKVQ